VPSAISVLASHLFSVDTTGALQCTPPPPAVVSAAIPVPQRRVVSTGVDRVGTLLNSHAARCLRPYQRIGVAWMLWRLMEAGGCILGDDMVRGGRPVAPLNLRAEGLFCGSYRRDTLPPALLPHLLRASARRARQLLCLRQF
jgi:hypothetical protein